MEHRDSIMERVATALQRSCAVPMKKGVQSRDQLRTIVHRSGNDSDLPGIHGLYIRVWLLVVTTTAAVLACQRTPITNRVASHETNRRRSRPWNFSRVDVQRTNRAVQATLQAI